MCDGHAVNGSGKATRHGRCCCGGSLCGHRRNRCRWHADMLGDRAGFRRGRGSSRHRSFAASQPGDREEGLGRDADCRPGRAGAHAAGAALDARAHIALDRLLGLVSPGGVFLAPVFARLARAGALDSLAGDFGAASLGMRVDEAQQAVSNAAGWMELSVVNSSASVVVSGDRTAVADLVADLVARDAFANSDDPAGLNARAYALYVLAKAKAASLSDLRYLFDTYLDRLPTPIAASSACPASTGTSMHGKTAGPSRD